MKKFRKVFIFIFAFVVMMSMSGFAFAETPNISIGNNVVKSAEKSEVGYTKQMVILSDYIKFYSPYNNQVFYRGEKIPVKFRVYDIWESVDVYTLPVLSIFDKNYNRIYQKDEDIAYKDYSDNLGSYTDYVETFSASLLPNGKYEFCVWGIPVDADGYSYEGSTTEDWEEAALDFYVTTLLAPTKVKAKAGKKKVTVTFAKASGASKYKIYRSAKKTKGYKAIKTTTKTKYVDKKVKKGKRYYYKVKSIRTVIGTVNSGYSKIVRSKKVKK